MFRNDKQDGARYAESVYKNINTSPCLGKWKEYRERSQNITFFHFPSSLALCLSASVSFFTLIFNDVKIIFNEVEKSRPARVKKKSFIFPLPSHPFSRSTKARLISVAYNTVAGSMRHDTRTFRQCLRKVLQLTLLVAAAFGNSETNSPGTMKLQNFNNTLT